MRRHTQYDARALASRGTTQQQTMENLIKPLQQWAMENQEERGVLVIATDEEKSGCLLTGTYFNIGKEIAHRASKSPKVYRILLMGLLATTKNKRFLSLRARLVAWLLK